MLGTSHMDRCQALLCLALLICCFRRVRQQEGGGNDSCLVIPGNEVPQNSLIVMLEVTNLTEISVNELMANLTSFVETCAARNNTCCEPIPSNMSNATLQTLCQLSNGPSSNPVLYLYDMQYTAVQLALFVGQFVAYSHLNASLNVSMGYLPPCCALALPVSSISTQSTTFIPTCVGCTGEVTGVVDSSYVQDGSMALLPQISSTPVPETSSTCSTVDLSTFALDISQEASSDTADPSVWPSHTMVVVLENFSNDSSLLTPHQLVSLGAGVGAFTILLFLLGFMVIVFWIRTERYARSKHRPSVCSVNSAAAAAEEINFRSKDEIDLSDRLQLTSFSDLPDAAADEIHHI